MRYIWNIQVAYLYIYTIAILHMKYVSYIKHYKAIFVAWGHCNVFVSSTT